MLELDKINTLLANRIYLMEDGRIVVEQYLKVGKRKPEVTNM